MMGGYELTKHAKQRMEARRISIEALGAALWFGPMVYLRGAVIFALGRKEARRWASHAVDLSEYEGVQVVCSHDAQVLTVYRSHNFRRLRPRCRAPIHRRSYFRKRRARG